MRTLQLTAIIESEGNGFVALCPEIDVASQGTTVAEAKANLKEAIELFFEFADADETAHRLPQRMTVEAIEVAVA